MKQKSLARLNKSEYDYSSVESRVHDGSDAGSQASGKGKKEEKKKPARYWTRVLSLSHRHIDCEEKFDVEVDKNMVLINE